MDISRLNFDELIGQRLIVGVNKKNIDIVISLVKKRYLGGVILYKKNYTDYKDMLKVIKRIKQANADNKVPLFIAVDQEGGIVNRLPEDIHNLINIYEVSMKDKDSVSKYAYLISKILTDTGINMNFAPVVDIYNNSKSKVLVKRCFYGDEIAVSEMASKYIHECKKNNVLAVIKHYPGHGASKMDSHLFIPYIFNYKEVINKHIIPFKKLLKKDADGVMVGHLLIRKMCGIIPASLNNRVISKELRHDNNYRGLIISDELNMIKHNLIYRLIYLDKILKSGNDMILIKVNNANEIDKMINKYKKILKETKYRVELDKHVERILQMKDKYNVNDAVSFEGVKTEDINKVIDEFNNNFRK